VIGDVIASNQALISHNNQFNHSRIREYKIARDEIQQYNVKRDILFAPGANNMAY